jgi:hypothetical protein
LGCSKLLFGEISDLPTLLQDHAPFPHCWIPRNLGGGVTRNEQLRGVGLLD